jgi:hypothetical protein
MSQEYSPRPRGENLLWRSTQMTGSSMDSSTQSLDFPLTAVNGIAGREREREGERDLHTIVKAKLEQLHSARLTHQDQEVRLLDIQDFKW